MRYIGAMQNMASYDLFIKGAKLYDGTGSEGRTLNVGVNNGVISLITDKDRVSFKKSIEGDGKILSPGFIDIHTHTDLEIMRNKFARPMLGQGITTSIGGNCGIGLYPYSKNLEGEVRDILGVTKKSIEFSSFGEYLDRLNEEGLAHNEAYFVAHMPLRLKAMSDASREATDDEIERMCAFLDEALSEGAVGFSTGLYYAPCMFSSKKELLRLLETVKKHDKLFSVHHRCEGDKAVNSLLEVLELAKESGVRLEVSHLKAIGKDNQDKVSKMLELIHRYRDDGVDVKFDQYPYTFGSTSLYSLLPPRILALSKIEERLALALDSERELIRDEMLSGDGWDSIYKMVGPDDIRISTLTSFPEYQGKSLSEIGNILGMDPLDALFDILSEETGEAVMIDRTESDENLIRIMKDPLMCFGSDSLYSSDHPHPRSFFAVIEYLSKYVRDKGVVSVGEGIRRLTGETADRLHLKNRGYIREGYKADLVLFDQNELGYDEKSMSISGIYSVIVNGVEAVSDGVFTGRLGGEALRV